MLNIRSLVAVATSYKIPPKTKNSLFFRNIGIKGRYEYQVRAETFDNEAGPFSPPLVYAATRGFCGDGKIDIDEGKLALLKGGNPFPKEGGEDPPFRH